MRLAAALFVAISLLFGRYACGVIGRDLGPQMSIGFAAEPFLPHDVRIDGTLVDPAKGLVPENPHDPILEYQYTGRRPVRVRVRFDRCDDDSFCRADIRPDRIEGNVPTEAP